MDSFSFMIIDRSNLVSVFESIPYGVSHQHFRYVDPVEILSIIQAQDLRYNRFDKVRIALDHPAFTYVPTSVFNQTAWYEYLNFLATGVRKDDVVSSPSALDSVCVYTYPLAIRKLLSTLYPTTRVQHLSESLAAFLEKEVEEEPTLFSIIHGAAQYIFIFEEKKLTLINRYDAPTSKDRLYYILLAAKHRKLNPRKLNVHITGDRTEVTELQEELANYFIHVHLIDWKNGWRLPLSIKDPMDIFEFYCIHHANNWRESEG